MIRLRIIQFISPRTAGTDRKVRCHPHRGMVYAVPTQCWQAKSFQECPAEGKPSFRDLQCIQKDNETYAHYISGTLIFSMLDPIISFMSNDWKKKKSFSAADGLYLLCRFFSWQVVIFYVFSSFTDPCTLACRKGNVYWTYGWVNDGIRCSRDIFNYDVCIEGKCRVSRKKRPVWHHWVFLPLQYDSEKILDSRRMAWSLWIYILVFS